MHEIDEARFAIATPQLIPPSALTPLRLTPMDGEVHGVVCSDGHLRFDIVGWFEVMLSVSWDPSSRTGTRFAHSKIPGQQPLHSEAIDAAVLAAISEGRQLLRGNTVMGHDHTTELVLEVWHDAGAEVQVRQAELVVRALVVPWTASDTAGRR